MRQIRREQQNKVAQNNKGMVNDDALFCIYQDKTLRHDVAKSASCRTGFLKSGREELCDTVSQSQFHTEQIMEI